MNKWYTRGLAILMTLAMLVSQMTVFAANPELPSYTSQLYRTPYDDTSPDQGLIDGTDNTVSFDDPSPIYYVVCKTELINQDNPNDPNNVQDGKVYRVSLPDPLVCHDTLQNVPLSYQNLFVFARVNATKGADYFDITFHSESEDPYHTLDAILNFHISFSCDWNRAAASQMDSDQDGAIDIATLPNATNVIVEDLKPAPPVETALTKTATTTDAGVTTWSVQCTVGNEEGKIPTELVDTLPEGLEYVEGSATVSTDGTSSAYSVRYDTALRQISYPLPSDAKKVTLEYQTKPSREVITKFWQDGKVPSFTNLAQAKNGSDVYATASRKITLSQLKPLLSKQYIDLDYEETSGTYYATWSITVDSQGQPLEQLTLHDTYGAALLLPRSSDGTVAFEEMEMKILYADPGGTPEPSIEIAESDVTLNADQRSIRIDLQPYFGQMAGHPNQAFRVTYKLQVDKAALQQGSSQESFRNQVYGTFQTEDMTQPADSTASTAVLPVKTENTLILQTGGKYNSATRALPWTTTINPGLSPDVHSPNLTSVVFEDRFVKGASVSEHFGFDYQCFGLTEADIQKQITSIETQIQQEFQKKGLDQKGATYDVTIETTAEYQVLRVELTNTGRESITFQYNTYLRRPEDWASNLGSRAFRNQVQLLKDGTKIDEEPISQNKTAVSHVYVGGTVLRKWPRDAYDTTNNRLDWGIEVNQRKAPLGKIQVVDVLPAGVTYIPGTARLKNGPAIPDNDADSNGNYVVQNGQTLTFYLNLEKPETVEIIYTTSVDTNSADMIQTTRAQFTNQAQLSIWSDSDQWVGQNSHRKGNSQAVLFHSG